MSERRWFQVLSWHDDHEGCVSMSDADVLTEMGGKRAWVCFIDQRITEMKWCRHYARPDGPFGRCGYYQIVKDADE